MLTDISDALIDFKVRQDFLSVLLSICSPFKFIKSVFGLKHNRGHKCSKDKVFYYTLFPTMEEGGRRGQMMRAGGKKEMLSPLTARTKAVKRP